MENEVLVNPPDKKISITLAEIKSYLEALDIADDAGDLPDEESFRRFLLDRSIMLGRIRDFLKFCLNRAGVAYREENFSMGRNGCLNLFFDVFEIAGENSEPEKISVPEQKDWREVLPQGLPSEKIIFDLGRTVQDWQAAGFGEFPADDAALRAALEKSPGKKVRAFLTKSLETYALEFNSDVVARRLEKADCINLLGELFSIAAAAEESPEIKSEPEKISAPPAVELTFEDVDEIYRNGRGIDAEEKIACKNLTFVKNMPLTAQKNKTIRLSEGIKIFYGQVALVNLETQKTAALGRLEGDGNEPALVFPADKIAFDRILTDSELYDLIIFPANFKRAANSEIDFYRVPCEASCREPENALRPLCIDFGTSNTTAGSYGVKTDGIDLVEFPDGAAKKLMLPTLIYVESCKDAQNVKYLFGYEAAARIEELHYEPRATVFHEIKSWIDDLEKPALIYDEQKHHTKIPRKTILKAYLDHVIKLAEEYFEIRFGELHFSAPVKLKGVFIDKMAELFKGERKIIESAVALDEGVAIVYDYIADRIEERDSDGEKVFAEGAEENVLILDCGGGTTDLAQCRYSYRVSDVDNSRRLTIHTEFENGDSAFGGNNITYRILQLLKIKIARSFSGENAEQDILHEIMNFSEYEIMSKIDEKFSAKAEIYQKFEESYAAAEKIISTRFAEPNLYPDEVRMRRRNYYYLWQMAEAIKIEFYKSTNTVAIDFDDERDREICVSGAENYYLYVCQKDGAKPEAYQNPLKNISVTIKEINRIICPDIYALLCTILNEYDSAGDNKLLKANFYKLSGQSCNISLFHDLLKEFIPGRRIRREKTRSDSAQDDRLKIACVKGSIRYLMDKNVGKITPDIRPAPPVPVYEILEADNAGEPVKGLFSKEKMNLDRKPANTRHIKIIVRDRNGRTRNVVTHEFVTSFDRKREINLADLSLKVEKKAELSGGRKEKFETDIIGKLGKINLILDNDRKSQFCLFVLPAKNGYGFLVYLLVVLIEGMTHKFYLQEDGKFYSYERLESFFDGER